MQTKMHANHVDVSRVVFLVTALLLIETNVYFQFQVNTSDSVCKDIRKHWDGVNFNSRSMCMLRINEAVHYKIHFNSRIFRFEQNVQFLPFKIPGHKLLVTNNLNS